MDRKLDDTMLNLLSIWGATPDDRLTTEILDLLDRLMALPLEIRLNLVAAVEAAARLEQVDPRPRRGD